jgi:hypothetical protein
VQHAGLHVRHYYRRSSLAIITVRQTVSSMANSAAGEF